MFLNHETLVDKKTLSDELNGLSLEALGYTGKTLLQLRQLLSQCLRHTSGILVDYLDK